MKTSSEYRYIAERAYEAQGWFGGRAYEIANRWVEYALARRGEDLLDPVSWAIETNAALKPVASGWQQCCQASGD